MSFFERSYSRWISLSAKSACVLLFLITFGLFLLFYHTQSRFFCQLFFLLQFLFDHALIRGKQIIDTWNYDQSQQRAIDQSPLGYDRHRLHHF